MKQFLTIIMLALPWMGCRAQTYSLTSGIFLWTDDNGVEFDFTYDNPFEGIEMTLERQVGSDYFTVHDIGSTLISYVDNYLNWVSGTSGGYGPVLIQSNYSSPLHISSSSYSITLGEEYTLSYYLPETFQYKLYCHNPYTSFRVNLCPVAANGQLMGSFCVAEIPMNMTPYLSQGYYFYEGDVVGSHVSYWSFSSTLELVLDRINPSVAYTDLWYYEFDENPTKENEHVHEHYGAAIDHFVIAIEFRGS